MYSTLLYGVSVVQLFCVWYTEVDDLKRMANERITIGIIDRTGMLIEYASFIFNFKLVCCFEFH